MNAAVTRNRNRELISRSGSHVRAADGVARGETPLAILFFFLREKRDVSRGVFYWRDLFYKMGSLSPLHLGSRPRLCKSYMMFNRAVDYTTTTSRSYSYVLVQAYTVLGRALYMYVIYYGVM